MEGLISVSSVLARCTDAKGRELYRADPGGLQDRRSLTEACIGRSVASERKLCCVAASIRCCSVLQTCVRPSSQVLSRRELAGLFSPLEACSGLREAGKGFLLSRDRLFLGQAPASGFNSLLPAPCRNRACVQLLPCHLATIGLMLHAGRIALIRTVTF